MQKPNILITGCSSGIGKVSAQMLKQRGWDVYASARKPEDVKALEQAGFKALQLDVDDSKSIGQAVDKMLNQTSGRIDALFNNAGFIQAGAVEDLSRKTIREQFETNIFGALELTNLVLPIMRKQNSGRVIFNSSMLGIVSLKYRGAYNASKFAMEGIADALRLELSGTPIKISLIEPGPILTALRANGLIKFKQNINYENSQHQTAYDGMLAKLNTKGVAAPFTLESDAVVKKLIHALESKRPKAHYPVTLPAHLSFLLRRILPVRLLDKVANKI